MARPANARLGTLQTPFRCLQTAYPRLDVFLVVSSCRGTLNVTPVGMVSPNTILCNTYAALHASNVLKFYGESLLLIRIALKWLERDPTWVSF